MVAEYNFGRGIESVRHVPVFGGSARRVPLSRADFPPVIS